MWGQAFLPAAAFLRGAPGGFPAASRLAHVDPYTFPRKLPICLVA
jgi:hypothetical protein